MGVGRISLWISNGLWPETDGQWKCASFGTKRINTLKIITGRNRRQCNDCGTMINCRSNVSHFQLCQDIKKKKNLHTIGWHRSEWNSLKLCDAATNDSKIPLGNLIRKQPEIPPFQHQISHAQQQHTLQTAPGWQTTEVQFSTYWLNKPPLMILHRGMASCFASDRQQTSLNVAVAPNFFLLFLFYQEARCIISPVLDQYIHGWFSGQG